MVSFQAIREKIKPDCKQVKNKDWRRSSIAMLQHSVMALRQESLHNCKYRRQKRTCRQVRLLTTGTYAATTACCHFNHPPAFPLRLLLCLEDHSSSFLSAAAPQARPRGPATSLMMSHGFILAPLGSLHTHQAP